VITEFQFKISIWSVLIYICYLRIYQLFLFPTQSLFKKWRTIFDPAQTPAPFFAFKGYERAEKWLIISMIQQNWIIK